MPRNPPPELCGWLSLSVVHNLLDLQHSDIQKNAIADHLPELTEAKKQYRLQGMEIAFEK